MNDHPTQEELSRFMRGGLATNRVATVVWHLEHCRPCVAVTLTSQQVARSSRSLARAIDPRIDEHPAGTLLTSYVDGLLGSADCEAVAAHLEVCPTCREDVDDLRATALLVAPSRMRRWAPLAAAAAVAIVVAALASRVDTPPAVPAPRVVQRPATKQSPAPVVTSPRYARAEWAIAVENALRRGTIDMPAALADLQLDPDPERAPIESTASVLEPASAIIETTRPRLRWTPIPDATYVVSIFDGAALIAESPLLHESKWQPRRSLPRGRTYQWQVSATSETVTTIMPAPPAPPALFRVLDAAAYEEIESARKAHADDALLLGVLYARMGLRHDAERELARVATAEGRALLQSVQAWQ
ncbi:MAG TPA: zf-HC2 domain-containing protein [Thermoanaerobaculia bacterium]|nr:zf-HC2 domain-containing protein [Thermoanaerobaculia bacterium]